MSGMFQTLQFLCNSSRDFLSSFVLNLLAAKTMPLYTSFNGYD